MTISTVKMLIDACFVAKKITELTPKLPEGMVPRHNNVIDAIHELGETKEHIFISDVSKRLGTTTPSITKLVGQLEEMGYLTKQALEEDKRYVSISLTEKGLKHYKVFVETYHTELSEVLSDMDDAAGIQVAEQINMLYDKIKAYNDTKKNYK